jgi:hypothetical protein
MTIHPTQQPLEMKFTLTELLKELQRENMRLQRLVSELLTKNQLLRKDS